MNFEFELIEILADTGGTIYTYAKAGETSHEWDKFKNDHQNAPPYDDLAEKIDSQVSLYGFDQADENDFLWEGRYISAHIPVYRFAHTGNLRLFCLIWNKQILILDNGGIKNGPGKLRMFPKLLEKTKELDRIYQRISERASSIGTPVAKERREGKMVTVFTFDLSFEVADEQNT